MSNDSEIEFTNIVTSYYEEKSVIEFVSRLIATMRSTGRTFEVILINDGSDDKTFEIQTELFDEYPEVSKAIDICRNAGQLAAMSCGVNHARGSNLIFLDSDLQLDPEEIPQLMKKFDEGMDAVSGVRNERRDHLLRRIPSLIVNIVTKRIALHPVSDIGCTFKIYRGSVVYPFEFGPYKLWNTAFVLRKCRDYAEVTVNHHERRFGKSGWTFRRLAYFLFDQVIGISSRPFLWLSFASFFLLILIVLKLSFSLFFGLDIIDQYSNGFIVNLLLIAIFVMFTGFSVIGEFIFQTYLHARKDPFYTIRTILSK